jgi:hypothetical protein
MRPPQGAQSLRGRIVIVITIAGSTHRSFTFPADLPTACAYYGDYTHIFSYLPHIRLVTIYAPGQFRMLYHTHELGIYRVQIYCDLQAKFDEKKRALCIVPLPGIPTIRPRVTLNSLTAQGHYESETVFHPAGNHTRVEYRLNLGAKMYKPLGLSLAPDSVLEQVARSITQARIREITDSFVERSIEDYLQGTTPPRRRAAPLTPVAHRPTAPAADA